MHTCSPSTLEIESGGLLCQRSFVLHGEFQASLSFLLRLSHNVEHWEVTCASQRNTFFFPLKQFLFFFFFNAYKCFACMFVYHKHACCVRNAEEGIWSSRSGIVKGCELPCACWELTGYAPFGRGASALTIEHSIPSCSFLLSSMVPCLFVSG